jgi:DNA-binding NarL/FixJ family response regulator
MLEVVAAESNLDETISKVQKMMLRLVLLDMTMPGSCSMARQPIQLYPYIGIIAPAVPEVEYTVIKCTEAGCRYIAREASIDELIQTVISATEGGNLLPTNHCRIPFYKNSAACMQGQGKLFIKFKPAA